jgi:hypothetical protein
VDSGDALIGLRQGTETPVVFVRRGVDSATIEELLSTASSAH